MIIRNSTIAIDEAHIDLESAILEIDVSIDKLGICICGIQVFIDEYDSLIVKLPEIFSTIESRPNTAIRFIYEDEAIDFTNNLIQKILKIKWIMEFLSANKAAYFGKPEEKAVKLENEIISKKMDLQKIYEEIEQSKYKN